MTRPVVVKVGGSLLDWIGLPGRLGKFLESRAPERLVVIVGGGRTTDVVRGLDRIHGLGPERSHQLALRALDLTAHLFAEILPRAVVVEDLAGLAPAWEHARTPVFAPRRFLDEVDGHSPNPLPATWDVTSDAIAARVASLLDARELVLCKSAPLPPGTDRRGAARLGLVDPVFPDVARSLERVAYLNLRDSQVIATVLEAESEPPPR